MKYSRSCVKSPRHPSLCILVPMSTYGHQDLIYINILGVLIGLEKLTFIILGVEIFPLRCQHRMLVGISGKELYIPVYIYMLV